MSAVILNVLCPSQSCTSFIDIPFARRNPAHDYLSLFELFNLWNKEADKLKNDEITQDEYNQWRYNYPHGVSSYKRVPSKEFSDAMVKSFLGDESVD